MAHRDVVEAPETGEEAARGGTRNLAAGWARLGLAGHAPLVGERSGRPDRTRGDSERGHRAGQHRDGQGPKSEPHHGALPQSVSQAEGKKMASRVKPESGLS